MIEAGKDPTRVEREAADWFSRMMGARIENEELEAFALWRRDPDNLAAYNRIDDISRMARSLRDHPDMRAAAAAALTRAKPRPWWAALFSSPPRRWGAGLAFAGLAAAALLGWRLTAPTYQTAVGQQLLAQLSDGSRVRLNTNTALKVRFDGRVRRVELLRGQALFDVAHDAAHPFVVVAGDTEVRALGTRFDVRREPDAVQVVLAEGRVAVSERGARPASWTLSPGQIVTTGAKTTATRPAAADVAAITAWTGGQLTFHATPLAEAVREINRYNRDKIVLGPGAPAEGRVNGSFPTDDPEVFVAAMSTLYGLRGERRPDGGVELRAASAPPS